MVYADDSGEHTGYEKAMASIGNFIQNRKRSCTNDDAIRLIVIIGLVAAKVAYALGDACKVAPPILNAPWVAAKVVAAQALVALETLAYQISFHDC